MNRRTIFILILIVVTGILYYHLTEEKIVLKDAKIINVIDGDTIETSDNIILRLKGINTPEKNEVYYQEAKKFLENLILDKEIQFEDHSTDKYGRTLAHIYLENSLINSKIVEYGLAYSYYYERDSHYDEILNAENLARANELNLWEESPDSYCLELLDLQYIEPNGRCNNGEILQIKNLCNKDLDTTIRDDATHIFKEKIKANDIFSKTFSCIWNDEGDTLYIRDNKGLLIFYRYP